MDLSQLSPKERAEEGVEMTVTHPVTGDPLKDEEGNIATITLAGVDSDRYREHQHKTQNRRLKTIGRTGRPKLDIDAKDVDKEGLELLAVCTLSWENISWRGAPLDCNFDNAVMIYSKLGWLREQVDSFIGDRENFFPKQ